MRYEKKRTLDSLATFLSKLTHTHAHNISITLFVCVWKSVTYMERERERDWCSSLPFSFSFPLNQIICNKRDWRLRTAVDKRERDEQIRKKEGEEETRARHNSIMSKVLIRAIPTSFSPVFDLFVLFFLRAFSIVTQQSWTFCSQRMLENLPSFCVINASCC